MVLYIRCHVEVLAGEYASSTGQVLAVTSETDGRYSDSKNNIAITIFILFVITIIICNNNGNNLIKYNHSSNNSNNYSSNS